MQDKNEWFYTGIYTPKGSSKKEACERERERELITQEVLQIKKAKNCAFTKWHKQAMNYLAWSTMPSNFV